MAQNFEASEIQRQASRLQSQTQALNSVISSLSNQCSTIAGLIGADDNDLTPQWNAMSNVVSGLGSKYTSALETMVERMNSYATKTTVHEKTIGAATEKAASTLEGLADKIRGIDV